MAKIIAEEEWYQSEKEISVKEAYRASKIFLSSTNLIKKYMANKGRNKFSTSVS